jgi:hypothetical protein
MLEIIVEDITRLDVDAIVPPTPRFLAGAASMARSIVRRGLNCWPNAASSAAAPRAMLKSHQVTN